VRVSIIIPVFNGAATLPLCLQAVMNSHCQIDECLVIDDGSTDASVSIATQLGATVLSTGGRFGPAKARNLGARCATGDLLVFIDADVLVHSDALGRIVERFNAEPELDAMIGAYDNAPSDPGFVSQFKNLMHAFVHQSGNREASTFWCGCGAVKRSVYLELGGLDESYRCPSIEDIEFGVRMLRSGRKLALDPQVQCKHLKVWTFWNLLRTDVMQRGIPWTELILRTRFLPDDLNLRWSQRISVLLSLFLVLLGGIEGLQLAGNQTLLSAPVGVAGIFLCLALICFLNAAFYQFLASLKGWRFSVLAVGLHVFYYVYSGTSFALGASLYGLRGIMPESSPAPAPKMPRARGEVQP
jgi:glycosyltransferase involved in cell wall biosynthesis